VHENYQKNISRFKESNMSNKLKKTSDFSDWNLVEGKRENSKRGCKVSYAFGPAINTGNLRKIFTKKQTKDMEKKYS
jgi:hypothetical protein